MIGSILDGRYRILRQLGAGGMGEVYLGEHLVLKRREAIKVLKSRLAGDEAHLARFRREARATNRVQHPNIVGFYDFGRLPDGRLYLTMEFADGPNLEEVLSVEHRMSAPRAVQLLTQLASAIGYAHSKGVIHRDLKPDNLVVVAPGTAREEIKILDFGVAKITAPGYIESMAISKEGEVFGTPAYVSPEQIRGVRDDPRIDIYSFGCIAYELVTGETPFVGRPMAVLEAHLDLVPPRPSNRCREAMIPVELEDIIMQCLSKDPAARPQTGEAIAEALLQVPLPEVRGASRRRRGRTSITYPQVDDATEEGLPGGISVGEQDTTGVFAKRAEHERNQILQRIAECMCDLGCSESRLLVNLAQLNQVQQDLGMVDQALDELARSESAVLQQAREREASLRFALGELNFNRSSGASDPQIDDAMNALQGRLDNLTTQTDQHLAQLTEQQIVQTAQRAHLHDELHELFEELERIVREHLPKMSHHESIAALLRQREQARGARA